MSETPRKQPFHSPAPGSSNPERREIGTTGLKGTPLGLGLAALGRPGYINLGHAGDFSDRSVEAMQAQAWRVLDAAWSTGVRYFDAARSYGRAEGFLGSWLRAREIDPAEVTVASKWGYTYTAAWRVNANSHEVKDHSQAVLQRQWVESQALLGDYLRLYQIHSATFDSGVLTNPAVLSQLAAYKADGMRIGLSLSGPAQADTLRAALLVEVDGIPLFDAVQATWNVLETSAEAALKEASGCGLAVIVKEGLANGRLTARNQEAGFVERRRSLMGIAERQGVGVDAIALAAILQQSWVDVVLSGAATEAQMVANSEALGLVLDEEAVAELANMNELPDHYWTMRSALAWN